MVVWCESGFTRARVTLPKLIVTPPGIQPHTEPSLFYTPALPLDADLVPPTNLCLTEIYLGVTCPTHERIPSKQKQTNKIHFKQVAFSFFSLTAAVIHLNISALLHDELLLVKTLQCFSVEPESRQSQTLTLLHCDMW